MDLSGAALVQRQGDDLLLQLKVDSCSRKPIAQALVCKLDRSLAG
jgi:hypothetical protein